MSRYRRGISAPGLSRGRPEGFDVLGKTLAMREVNFCPATFFAGHAGIYYSRRACEGYWRRTVRRRGSSPSPRSLSWIGLPLGTGSGLPRLLQKSAPVRTCPFTQQFGLKRASVIERQQARQIQAPSWNLLLLWHCVTSPIDPQAWDQRRGREYPAKGRIVRRLGRLRLR